MDIEQLANNYQLSQATRDLVKSSCLVFLVGGVAAGKDTIKRRLLDDYKDYQLFLTCTTRLPRLNNGKPERDGVDYHFVDEPTLASYLQKQSVIEVNHFGDRYYATIVDDLIKANQANKVAIASIDINGVESFWKISDGRIGAIFIVPPSYEVWLERFKSRYGDNQDSFSKEWMVRREITINELEIALGRDYFYFVINDKLDDAVNEVNQTIQDIFSKKDYDDSMARQVAKDILNRIKQSPSTH